MTECVFNHKLSLFYCPDFTALLVDIIGNSTSYLTEIFKSTSILSGLHFLLTSIIVLFVWFTSGVGTSIKMCIKAYCSYSASFFLQSMDCSCKRNLLRRTRYIYNVYIYNIETYMFLGASIFCLKVWWIIIKCWYFGELQFPKNNYGLYYLKNFLFPCKNVCHLEF